VNTLRLSPLVILIIVTTSCSPAPPVVVTDPDESTLESLDNKPVTLEGQVIDGKEGYILHTSGPQIHLEYRGAQDGSWPKVGTRVQVSGTLRVIKEARPGYRFHLEYPQSRTLENTVR
jgi:hypothetical protein